MTDKQKLPNEMTNSHILVQSFDYHEPITLDEAIALLGKYGRRARLVVGCYTVLTNMKMEKDVP
jgi:CO/xanthine dehydrogenase FAD-binding subunit